MGVVALFWPSGCFRGWKIWGCWGESRGNGWVGPVKLKGFPWVVGNPPQNTIVVGRELSFERVLSARCNAFWPSCGFR